MSELDPAQVGKAFQAAVAAFAAAGGADFFAQLTEEVKADTWTAAYINALPDQAFAVISPGGKAAGGKTTPRTLRHLPHHSQGVQNGDAWDHVDMPHLRNALSRLPQSNLSSAEKATASRHLQHHVQQAKEHGAMAEWQPAELDQMEAVLEALACEYEAQAERGDPAPPTLDELFVQATRNRDRLAREAGSGEGVPVTLEAEAIEIVAAAEPAKEDKFWPQARKRIGIQEDHSNAMFLVATLFHTDQPNLNGDMISQAEAEAALPSLAFQPIDMAPTMDTHERERMYGMNGIRGFVYASRMVDNQAQVGVVLWARDFPDIAQKVVDFRDSLGASFDLVAQSADIMNLGGKEKTQRNLKGITFLGGALLAKARAGDPNTTIGNVRYQGKPIEQLEEDKRMAENAKLNGTEAATPTPETAATAANPTPAAVTTEQSPVERALAETQARVLALETAVEQASLKAQAAEVKQQEAETQLAAMTARAEKAEGELTAQAEAAAQVERIKTRFAALEAMAGEAKRVLFEDEAGRQTLLAEIAELADSDFDTFKLRKELELLKAGKAAPAERNVEAQAARQTPVQPGAFSGLSGTGTGINPGSEDPRELGRRLANARRGVKTE